MLLHALFLFLAASSGPASGATPLYFSFITSFGQFGYNASGVVPAVDLALEQINNRSDLLAGYKLGYLRLQDSKASAECDAYC